MTVHEPMTLATDLALAGLTAVFAARLFHAADGSNSPAVRLWGFAFVCSAGAALLGGLNHGFGPELDRRAPAALWKATLLVGGGTSVFLVASAARAVFSPRGQRIALAVAFLKLAAYAVWVSGHPVFKWLVYDYGSAMLAVAALQGLRLWREPGAPGAWWILGGIAASIGAALVQASGFALHRHFNHNDLFHVLQMGATTLLYRGGRSMRGLPVHDPDGV
jgi:hypothetical protein